MNFSIFVNSSLLSESIFFILNLEKTYKNHTDEVILNVLCSENIKESLENIPFTINKITIRYYTYIGKASFDSIKIFDFLYDVIQENGTTCLIDTATILFKPFDMTMIDELKDIHYVKCYSQGFQDSFIIFNKSELIMDWKEEVIKNIANYLNMHTEKSKSESDSSSNDIVLFDVEYVKSFLAQPSVDISQNIQEEVNNHIIQKNKTNELSMKAFTIAIQRRIIILNEMLTGGSYTIGELPLRFNVNLRYFYSNPTENYPIKYDDIKYKINDIYYEKEGEKKEIISFSLAERFAREKEIKDLCKYLKNKITSHFKSIRSIENISDGKKYTILTPLNNKDNVLEKFNISPQLIQLLVYKHINNKLFHFGFCDNIDHPKISNIINIYDFVDESRFSNTFKNSLLYLTQLDRKHLSVLDKKQIKYTYWVYYPEEPVLCEYVYDWCQENDMSLNSILDSSSNIQNFIETTVSSDLSLNDTHKEYIHKMFDLKKSHYKVVTNPQHEEKRSHLLIECLANDCIPIVDSTIRVKDFQVPLEEGKHYLTFNNEDNISELIEKNADNREIMVEHIKQHYKKYLHSKAIFKNLLTDIINID